MLPFLARGLACRNQADSGHVGVQHLVNMGHGQQSALTALAQGKPAFLCLAVHFVEDGQRQRIEHHGCGLGKRDAMLDQITLRLGVIPDNIQQAFYHRDIYIGVSAEAPTSLI